MKLYGTDACADCILARKLLKKYGVDFDWIDISDIPDFNGEIPQLEIDDIPSAMPNIKHIITGYNNIAKYLRFGHELP